MSEDQEIVEQSTETQESEVTTTADSQEQVSEKNSEESNEPKEVKTFTQEELEKIVQKRLDRDRRSRDNKRAQEQLAEQTRITAPVGELSSEDFSTTEEYADALAQQKAEKLVYEREQIKQRAEVITRYNDLCENVRDKYDDFDSVLSEVTSNEKVTGVMAEAILHSDIGPELSYYLGKNPSEIERISRLSPVTQISQLGRLEEKLTVSPTVKKVTNAPSPISPVKTGSSGVGNYDPSDPRSIQSMSMAEWAKQRMIQKSKSRSSG